MAVRKRTRAALWSKDAEEERRSKLGSSAFVGDCPANEFLQLRIKSNAPARAINRAVLLNNFIKQTGGQTELADGTIPTSPNPELH